MRKILKTIIRSKPLFIASVCLIALILLFGILATYTYAYGRVFPRISAGGISLGGRDRDGIIASVNDECKARFDNASVTIALEDIAERIVTAEELSVSFPADEVADAALAYGREGGLFSRLGAVLGTIFGGHELNLQASVDEAAINSICAELSAHDVAPSDASFEVSDKELILYPRKNGYTLDTKKLSDEIISRFTNENFETLSVTRDETEAARLDLDKVYAEVHKVASDARIEQKNNENIIVPHVIGVDFDLDAAKVALDKSPDTELRIPLTITNPKLYTQQLESTLFKATLADVTTHFSPKKVARTTNVRLAAKLMNGTVLNPGEEFSYNSVIGPRTEARGFKPAAIFASGEVVDGIGGGICQVSSTLYMAAMRADMKITQRRNHAFYVDYAPKGEDATVVYGSIDFKFVNTSPYPIKIVSSSKNNYIRVRIMGTKTSDFSVKFTKKTLSTRPFTETVKNSSEVAKGERKVDQKGQQGLTMEVYRNVYDASGKLLRSDFENKSIYKPMPQIVLVGTAAAASSPSVPASSTTPAAPSAPTAPTEPAKDPATEATEAEIEEGNNVPSTPEIPTSTPNDTPPDWIAPSESATENPSTQG